MHADARPLELIRLEERIGECKERVASLECNAMLQSVDELTARRVDQLGADGVDEWRESELEPSMARAGAYLDARSPSSARRSSSAAHAEMRALASRIDEAKTEAREKRAGVSRDEAHAAEARRAAQVSAMLTEVSDAIATPIESMSLTELTSHQRRRLQPLLERAVAYVAARGEAVAAVDDGARSRTPTASGTGGGGAPPPPPPRVAPTTASGDASSDSRRSGSVLDALRRRIDEVGACASEMAAMRRRGEIESMLERVVAKASTDIAPLSLDGARTYAWEADALIAEGEAYLRAREAEGASVERAFDALRSRAAEARARVTRLEVAEQLAEVSAATEGSIDALPLSALNALRVDRLEAEGASVELAFDAHRACSLRAKSAAMPSPIASEPAHARSDAHHMDVHSDPPATQHLSEPDMWPEYGAKPANALVASNAPLTPGSPQLDDLDKLISVLSSPAVHGIHSTAAAVSGGADIGFPQAICGRLGSRVQAVQALGTGDEANTDRPHRRSGSHGRRKSVQTHDMAARQIQAAQRAKATRTRPRPLGHAPLHWEARSHYSHVAHPRQRHASAGIRNHASLPEQAALREQAAAVREQAAMQTHDMAARQIQAAQRAKATRTRPRPLGHAPLHWEARSHYSHVAHPRQRHASAGIRNHASLPEQAALREQAAAVREQAAMQIQAHGRGQAVCRRSDAAPIEVRSRYLAFRSAPSSTNAHEQAALRIQASRRDMVFRQQANSRLNAWDTKSTGVTPRYLDFRSNQAIETGGRSAHARASRGTMPMNSAREVSVREGESAPARIRPQTGRPRGDRQTPRRPATLRPLADVDASSCRDAAEDLSLLELVEQSRAIDQTAIDTGTNALGTGLQMRQLVRVGSAPAMPQMPKGGPRTMRRHMSAARFDAGEAGSSRPPSSSSSIRTMSAARRPKSRESGGSGSSNLPSISTSQSRAVNTTFMLPVPQDSSPAHSRAPSASPTRAANTTLMMFQPPPQGE